MGLLHAYWSWVGGNVGAMPLQGVIAIVFAAAVRKPLGRAWHRAVGERADLADIRRAADAAHKIAADLFEHHIGTAHPSAPDPGEKGRQ